MEGSGPPFSQELVYANEALDNVNRLLTRLYMKSLQSEGEVLYDVMRAVARISNQLKSLAEQIREREGP